MRQIAARPKPRRVAMSRNEKKEIAARCPARAPTHPGAILREDVMPAIGEAAAGVARKLGGTRQHLYRVLAETAPVSPAMATPPRTLSRNGPQPCLRRRPAYALWHPQR